jgi:hypothetical protein
MPYMAFFRDPLTNRDTRTHVVNDRSGLPECGAKGGSHATQHRVLGNLDSGKITCKRCQRLYESGGNLSGKPSL